MCHFSHANPKCHSGFLQSEALDTITLLVNGTNHGLQIGQRNKKVHTANLQELISTKK